MTPRGKPVSQKNRRSDSLGSGASASPPEADNTSWWRPTQPKPGRCALEEPPYLADLTPAQKQAVLHRDGPLVVLAGPGSGKTRVITRRIVHLLADGVPAEQILAITFTNKAAREMQHRVENLLPQSGVWISTFHSFAARILRQYADRLGLDGQFTIYDQDDRKEVLREVLDEAQLDQVRFSADSLLSVISRAKNALLSPHEFAARASDYFSQKVAEIYPLYERKMRALNALDFDDLLYCLARALRAPEWADWRAELDARFRYILVDEYQDTNHAQYVILRELSRDYPNVCVVGDPDQSIYRWRGADIQNILDFERDYPNCTVVRLDENFRSTAPILHVADQLIAHNRQRKPRQLYTNRTGGEPVQVYCFASSDQEADFIAELITRSVTSGRRKYADFAIFLRINALSRIFEEAFLRRRVPYQIVRGLAFFERKENRDILAFLRLLVNPRDDISFQRAILAVPCGVGNTTLERLRHYAEPRGLSLLEACAQAERIPQLQTRVLNPLKNFARLIRELQQLADQPAADIIATVIDRTGYRKQLLDSGEEEDRERLANIEELISAAEVLAEETGDASLAHFLEHVALVSDVDGLRTDQDAVVVMTLHAAKGLEFPVVFIPCLEEGLLPHERSREKQEELEEERRLLFVGITRAREELHLSCSRLRLFRGQTRYCVPSSFLSELPESGVVVQDLTRGNIAHGPGACGSPWSQTDDSEPTALALPGATPRASNEECVWRPGLLVRHQIYGIGSVAAVNGVGPGLRATIRFVQGGEKTFVVAKAPLEILSCSSHRPAAH
ncbi:MAG: UvrD-helicase domain-containing protein [Gemmatales bacterium]|nr:UvrD-helicase domain-containing protein [Gemmatales bacterium]MDW8176118.1 UvrD-helicase domain-containing protein [Gemmatales bacterium]